MANLSPSVLQYLWTWVVLLFVPLYWTAHPTSTPEERTDPVSDLAPSLPTAEELKTPVPMTPKRRFRPHKTFRAKRDVPRRRIKKSQRRPWDSDTDDSEREDEIDSKMTEEGQCLRSLRFLVIAQMYSIIVFRSLLQAFSLSGSCGT